MFNDQQFSKDLKIQKYLYLEGQNNDLALINNYLQALANFNPLILKNDTEKKAFWFNVYNGLTNTIIILRKVKKSMMSNPTLFFIPKYQVGNYKVSLDDIEHGILRRNKRASYKPWSQFFAWQKIKQLMVDTVDYRLHFALNCGAKSCPPIAFYDPQNLENQLQLADEVFAEQYWKVNDKTKTIQCSMIYKAHKSDFDKVYLNAPKYVDYKVEIMKYDWDIG